VSLVTTVPSVLSRRRTRRRSRTNRQHQAEVDRFCRLDEDFAMFVDIPPGVKWGDLAL